MLRGGGGRRGGGLFYNWQNGMTLFHRMDGLSLMIMHYHRYHYVTSRINSGSL